MKYTAKTLDEVRRFLGGCPEDTQVEVEEGIPVTAKTVADLRALSTWPRGDWVLDVPVNGGDQRYSVVRVEWPFLYQLLTCLADACFIVRDANGHALVLRLLSKTSRGSDRRRTC